MLRYFHLAQDESDTVRGLLGKLASEYDSTEDRDFLYRAEIYGDQLPIRLRQELQDFKLKENAGALIVSGFSIEQEKIGKTPEHWKNKKSIDRSPALEEEMFFVLCSSRLGYPIGWATQQDGYILHDVLPIREHEAEQLGSGSKQLLWWHIEDAFHPFRGDYIGLMCLRNPDQVPSTVCSIDQLSLKEKHKSILFEPRFKIRPDESHLIKNKSDEREVDGSLSSSYAKIEEMSQGAEKISVLFGYPESPYMRLDPYFMDHLDDDPEAQEALDALVEQIDENLKDLVLNAGEVCFIDNYRTVHGRRPFEARYDGNDRWLKRLNIVRDLRKSRSSRKGAQSLVIG